MSEVPLYDREERLRGQGTDPNSQGGSLREGRALVRAHLVRLLITEFIKEVSPLLPNPCHCQDHEKVHISPRSAWFRRMPPEDTSVSRTHRTPTRVSLYSQFRAEPGPVGGRSQASGEKRGSDGARTIVEKQVAVGRAPGEGRVHVRLVRSLPRECIMGRGHLNKTG